MDLNVLGQPTRIYCGGRSFDRRLPAVVLIHGAGHDHSVWQYQARHLAHHGFAVLAPDLPGHGASAGEALTGIAALAEWIEALLDAAGVARAALVGHSMGSLVALACSARSPRISALVLVGSVAPMPVAAPLLDAARSQRARAHAMINQWSYVPASHIGASACPGLWLPGLNAALMARQRMAQVQALCALQESVVDSARVAAAPRVKEGNASFAPWPRPPAALLCGDFNCEPGSAEHAVLRAGPHWHDAWVACHGDLPHAPTVGLHGAEWPQRAYCCDYFCVTGELLPRLADVAVDGGTAASDHQPVTLDLFSAPGA